MDERLEAGRHHLNNGDRALRNGHFDEGRVHFESALLQFRGPELRLGEAHAMRGLGQLELGLGDIRAASDALREAIDTYEGLRRQLDRFDHAGISVELRRDSVEGQATALVLLCDCLARTSQPDEAREAVSQALDLFEALGPVPSEALAWAALARLELREGRSRYALDAYDKALGIHRKSGDLTGQVSVLQGRAELFRVQRDLPAAEQALILARDIAGRTRDPRLEGRVLSALGSLMIQAMRLPEAAAFYREALPLVRTADDREVEGYTLVGLGEVESRSGDGAALDFLVDGARVLGKIEHAHGMAGALLRIAEHGLRFNEPALALAAAEGARRLWTRTDPVRGVGFALRLVVKALAQLRHGRAVLAAALTREAVAGHLQPNARAVAGFYRERAPAATVRELDALETHEKLRVMESLVDRILEPAMVGLGLELGALSTTHGALAVVEALAARLPRPSPGEDSWNSGDMSVEELAAVTADQVTVVDGVPPTDPGGPDAVPGALYVPFGADLVAEEEIDDDASDGSFDDLTPLPVPAVSDDYLGVYDPPAIPGSDEDDD